MSGRHAPTYWSKARQSIHAASLFGLFYTTQIGNVAVAVAVLAPVGSGLTRDDVKGPLHRLQQFCGGEAIRDGEGPHGRTRAEAYPERVEPDGQAVLQSIDMDVQLVPSL